MTKPEASPNNEVRAAIERAFEIGLRSRPKPFSAQELVAHYLTRVANEPAVVEMMLETFFKDGEAPIDSMRAALKALSEACKP